MQYNMPVLQGSIQATLAAAPLELAHIYKQHVHQYTTWAEAITVVGVFSILIGATITWLAAAFLGPALLTKVSMLFGCNRLQYASAHLVNIRAQILWRQIFLCQC